MSERGSIEDTQEYIIAHATPTTEDEREFLVMYKTLYESWRENGHDYDSPEWKQLRRLNAMPLADVIYEREWQKRADANRARYYAEKDAEFDELRRQVQERQERLKEEKRLQEEEKRNRLVESDNPVRAAPQENRETGKAVLWTVLFFICEGIVFLLASFLIGFLAMAISAVPFLETLFAWLLKFFDGLLGSAIPVVAGYLVSVGVVLWLANFNAPTERFFHKIVGIVILVSQAIFLVINLIDGSNVWANIIHLGFGIRFLLMSRE